MNKSEAWRFLVSRNQYLDYRTVVAPNFMCEAKTSSLIAKVAEGDLTERGIALYREIHNSKVGNLTLFFRVVEATTSDIGIEGNGVLKDSFGREIYLIEGIALRELRSDIVVTQEHFEEIHQQLGECYRAFWDCTITTSAMPSEPFILETENSSIVCLKYINLKEYNLDSKQQVSTELITPREQKKSWQCLSTEEFESEISSVTFLPRGNFVAIRYGNNVVLYNLSEKQKTYYSAARQMLGGVSTPVAISSDGKLLASAMIESPDQNVVKLWDVNTKKETSFHGHRLFQFGRVLAVAFTPDSKKLVSAGNDETIYLWDIAGDFEPQKFYGHSSPVRALVTSPDGQTLASGDRQGDLKIWNLKTRQESRSIKAHSSPINSLAFSADNKTIASGSNDHSIKLWNAKTGKEICTIGQHTAQVNSVAFSPDGKILASGSDDYSIKLWGIENQQEICTLSGHTREVTSVDFNSKGQIASGSKDRTIKIWEG